MNFIWKKKLKRHPLHREVISRPSIFLALSSAPPCETGHPMRTRHATTPSPPPHWTLSGRPGRIPPIPASHWCRIRNNRTPMNGIFTQIQYAWSLQGVAKSVNVEQEAQDFQASEGWCGVLGVLLRYVVLDFVYVYNLTEFYILLDILSCSIL